MALHSHCGVQSQGDSANGKVANQRSSKQKTSLWSAKEHPRDLGLLISLVLKALLSCHRKVSRMGRKSIEWCRTITRARHVQMRRRIAALNQPIHEGKTNRVRYSDNEMEVQENGLS